VPADADAAPHSSSAVPSRATSHWRSITTRPWWPAARRTAVVLFFLAVIGLLGHQAREIEWSAVLRSMRGYPLRTLLAAAGISAGSYAIYSSYDLIARWHFGYRLSVTRVMRTGFIAYAFNLTLGAWIGAVALRYRLYARLGLGADDTTRIVALSLVTNWLGYCFLAGVVFVVRPLLLPPAWQLGSEGLRFVGIALLLVVVAYIGLCFFAKQRTWHVGGHAFDLPAGRVAATQLLMSSCNWLLGSAIVYLLLQGKVDYPSTLSVMLLGAMAGVIARVPAGLGILEGVFVSLLSHRVAQGELVAALLAYRAIYQLGPLLLAAIWLVFVDTRARGKAGAA
jgi:uncharacterized membrane protein YbhN (UPF0104 family)